MPKLQSPSDENAERRQAESLCRLLALGHASIICATERGAAERARPRRACETPLSKWHLWRMRTQFMASHQVGQGRGWGGGVGGQEDPLDLVSSSPVCMRVHVCVSRMRRSCGADAAARTLQALVLALDARRAAVRCARSERDASCCV